MMTPNGGVFGRNPKFNNVTVTGTLTSAGSITIGSGSNLVMASGNGISFSGTSDPSIPAVAATGFLTRTATNVANNDTVTLGSSVYTFKTTLTPANWEVLIGADASASLSNLRNAINNSGGTPGTDYVVPSANASATASAIVDTTLPLVAIATGTGGNSIALAEASAQLTASGATLTGGRDAGAVLSELLADYETGSWTPSFSWLTTVGDLTVNYVVRSGWYVKIGNQVTVFCSLQFTPFHTTSVGTGIVTGLPYTSSGVPGFTSATALGFFRGVTMANFTQFSISPIGNTANASLRASAQGQNDTPVQVANLASGTLKALSFTMTYYVN